ncbi:hypothetical protein EH221_00225 [bacterium]|nr:MAG: hypothetical protein EH221_00225 [bacterium]
MNRAFHLYQLQKVDNKLHSIQKRITEIDTIIENDRRLIEVENGISSIKSRIDKTNKELRELEEIGKEIQMEIEINETALYSGKIRNPKELNDLQQKINIDKKNLNKNENEQLEKLMTIEAYEDALGENQQLLVKVQSQVATSHAILYGEKSQLLKQKMTLETERSAKQASIPADNLETYNQLLQEKRGVAVALVEDLSCTMCGAPLTPAEWQSVRSSETILFCSTCGRILYAE